MDERDLTWDQRVLAAVPSGVDPTLIAESLRLTPAERLARLQRLVKFVEAAHLRAAHAVPGSPRTSD